MVNKPKRAGKQGGKNQKGKNVVEVGPKEMLSPTQYTGYGMNGGFNGDETMLNSASSRAVLVSNNGGLKGLNITQEQKSSITHLEPDFNKMNDDIDTSTHPLNEIQEESYNEDRINARSAYVN